jgi:3-phosphoshikimate 1-carboxyvinyltransferase
MKTTGVRWIEPLGHRVDTTVDVPGSKSINNRVLLLAGLAKGDSTLSNILVSDDTDVFLNALRSLGIGIEFDPINLTCQISGGAGRVPSASGDIWCGGAGTAARFLVAAISAAGRGEYRFEAIERMRSRPIQALLKGLEGQGVIVTASENGSFPVAIKTNGLVGGKIDLADGDQSSQYLSALLMAAPLAAQPVEIQTDLSVSRPYVDMTVHLMGKFGVNVGRTDYNLFTVDAPKIYQGCNYIIEADASTASYFFAVAAMTGGKVGVNHITRSESIQGDLKFLGILEQMGCKVEQKGASVVVEGPQVIHGVTVDMRDISDTVMSLVAIAPFADSPTTITNIQHIRLKESDRLDAIMNNLTNIGIKCEIGDSFLRVYPGRPVGGVIDTYDDHRIAMSFSLVGLLVPGIGIDGSACVSKTCPEFYEILGKL